MEMSSVRSMLGLRSGGQMALTACALLAGGDYLPGGLKGVAIATAMDVVEHLLHGHLVSPLSVVC